MTDEIDERLREVAATVLDVDPDALSDATSPQTLMTWTSVRHLSLIAAVEEAFSIHFSMADIYAAQTLGALRSLVSERVVGRGSPHG
jgi:acyl carrier protein